MKKSVSIILAFAFLLCLSACGSDTGEKEAAGQAPASPAAAIAEGTELDTEFWCVTYSDDWNYDKDNDFYESDGYYSSVTLSIMDGDDALVSVYIDATLETPGSYRDYLKDAGIDAYELAVDKTVELVPLGGVDCVSCETEYWGDPVLSYYGRDEGAGATVIVQITGDYDDPRVAELLDTLTFSLEDTGNIDPPWPWDGEPYSIDSSFSPMVGSYTVTSQWLPADVPLVADDTFSGRIAAAGDTVYVLLDGKLMQYSYDGGKLTFDKNIPLDEGDNTYEEICACSDGVLYVSGFMLDFIGIKDGEKVFSYSGPDYVAMHPSGTWGISWFSGPDVQKITLSDGKLQTEDLTFAELDIISGVNVGEDHIFVSGSSAESGEQAVFVYDQDGNLQFTLGGTEFGEADSLGSVTQVIQTQSGYIGLDGNMRAVCFWTSDGSFVGSLDDSDLFGTNYPWMSAASSMPDGSVLVGMTDERPDKSADEFIVYRLSGF